MSRIYFNFYQISQFLEEESGACCAEAGEGPGEMMARWHLTARLLTLCLDCGATSPAWPIPLPLCAGEEIRWRAPYARLEYWQQT